MDTLLRKKKSSITENLNTQYQTRIICARSLPCYYNFEFFRQIICVAGRHILVRHRDVWADSPDKGWPRHSASQVHWLGFRRGKIQETSARWLPGPFSLRHSPVLLSFTWTPASLLQDMWLHCQIVYQLFPIRLQWNSLLHN